MSAAKFRSVSLDVLARESPALAQKLKAIDENPATGNQNRYVDELEIAHLSDPGDRAAYHEAAKKIVANRPGKESGRALMATGGTIAAAAVTAGLAPVAVPAVVIGGLALTVAAILSPMWTRDDD